MTIATAAIGQVLDRQTVAQHFVKRPFIPPSSNESNSALARSRAAPIELISAARLPYLPASLDPFPRLPTTVAMADINWIDRQEYPFASRFFNSERGRLHYVDEGRGQPIVMVHGTPTWSFLYRELIKGLSGSHRCIAVDHLGFGLSDKPSPALRPEEHARVLQAFIDSLGLGEFTLVIHDFGGPIGLSYALAKPASVRRLVLFNTWMWPVKNDPHFERPARLFSGALGRFLYLRGNFAVNVMMKFIAASRIAPVAWRHYRQAQASTEARTAAWTLARELTGSTDWYASLFQRRAEIANKPALILWGLKDQAFPCKILQNWSLLFTNAQIHSFPDAGHFVMEDKGAELVPLVTKFIQDH
jgi:haloalkane dehalogenase